MPDVKYRLKVIVPLGVKILDRPGPKANKRRDEPLGATLDCTDILLIEGVGYGELEPRDPLKQEFVRISEAGGLFIDQLTGKVVQVDGVLTYCKVITLPPPVSDMSLLGLLTGIWSDIKRIASAVEKLANKGSN